LFPPGEAFEGNGSMKRQKNHRIVTTTGGGAIILTFVVVTLKLMEIIRSRIFLSNILVPK
jgi:hypothetical protein